nr:MAG TPA: Nitrile hydratase beta subunit [Bacteriophage sp.]
MKKRKFKVGDRVKVKKNTVTLNIRTVGECGTVKKFLTDNYYSVEFDKFVGGHDCKGFAKYGYGWNCAEDALDLVKHQNETIVIYRNDNKVVALDKSTGEKAEAKCNPADEFDFRTGAKLAFNRLMGEDVKPDNSVREVKRKAKVGEYIKIVDAQPWMIPYKNGDIFKVISTSKPGVVIEKDGKPVTAAWHREYVVLENYKPEEKAQEHNDSEIHVGDMVEVTYRGNCYSTYDTWSGLGSYKQNYVKGVSVEDGMVAKVLNIANHDDMHSECKPLALIQNPKTSQVFIIDIDGIKKVER